jgi:hypothetical protein
LTGSRDNSIGVPTMVPLGSNDPGDSRGKDFGRPSRVSDQDGRH